VSCVPLSPSLSGLRYSCLDSPCIMQNMRRAAVCAAVAVWGATGVGADTCASVAASSSIQIKKQFDIGYASMFSPFSS
jgi:hypothetical protein